MRNYSSAVAAVLALGAATTARAQGTDLSLGEPTVVEAGQGTATTADPAAGMSLSEKELKFGPGRFPLRQDFTVELGVGIGAGYIRSGEFPQRNILGGGSLINFSIGGFFNESIALLAHYASLAVFNEQPLLNWLGPQLQWWPNDKLTIGIGVGVGGLTGSNPTTGFGFSIKAGYALWQGERHTIRIAMEGLPIWLDGTAGTSILNYGHLLLVEWQSH